MAFQQLPIEQGSDLQNPPKQYTITLAGDEIRPFDYNFNFFRFLTLSGADAANLSFRFGDSGADSDVIGAGVGYELPYVTNRITFKNKSASPITFTFIIAIGRIYDDRLSVSGVITTTEATPTIIDSQADQSIPNTTATQFLAANSSRKEAIIQNPIANLASFRIGDSGVSATNGILLPPGGTLVLNTTAALFAYHAAGSAQSIIETEINS